MASANPQKVLRKLQKHIESDKLRNLVAIAMRERFAKTTTKMRDKRKRRAKDYKNSWRRDWE